MIRRSWPDGTVVISVEGIDGAGKSTLVSGLADHFRQDEPAAHLFLTREFSGPIGRALESSLGQLSPLARAYAFAAERHSVVDKIVAERPDLVLWDRYVDSAVASRRADALLGADDGERLLAVAQDIAKFFPKPDLTLLLDLDAETAATRSSARGQRAQPSPYDMTGLRFLRDSFLECERVEAARFVRIDARQTPKDVLRDALTGMRDVYPRRRSAWSRASSP